MEVLWRRTVLTFSSKFRAIGKCAFPQIIHTTKLDGNMLLYRVLFLKRLKKGMKRKPPCDIVTVKICEIQSISHNQILKICHVRGNVQFERRNLFLL